MSGSVQAPNHEVPRVTCPVHVKEETNGRQNELLLSEEARPRRSEYEYLLRPSEPLAHVEDPHPPPPPPPPPLHSLPPVSGYAHIESKDFNVASQYPPMHSNLDQMAASAQTIRSIVRIMERLRRMRTTLLDLRADVDAARDRASKQRKRARLAQKRLLDAQIAPTGENVRLEADENIIKLGGKTRSATRESKTCDEKLEKAEKRLIGFEFKLECQERELYSMMDIFVSHAGADVGSEESAFEDAESVTASASQFSDDLPPLVREYHDAVGRINILRERLNDFEISYRQIVARREDEFDQAVAARQAALDSNVLFEETEAEFFANLFNSNEQFLNNYFQERTARANELLETKDRAERLRKQCKAESLETEDPDAEEPNALEEALKYNLLGNIGRMYSLWHEGQHRGVRPLDLVRVPFLHARQRVAVWLHDVQRQTTDMSIEELAERATSSSPWRSFELYWDVPFNDAEQNPTLTSVTEYKPSHTVTSQEDDLNETRTAYTGPPMAFKRFRHWTAWSGEWDSTVSAKSLPEIAPETADHFAQWTLPRTRSIAGDSTEH